MLIYYLYHIPFDPAPSEYFWILVMDWPGIQILLMTWMLEKPLNTLQARYYVNTYIIGLNIRQIQNLNNWPVCCLPVQFLKDHYFDSGSNS